MGENKEKKNHNEEERKNSLPPLSLPLCPFSPPH